MVYVEFQDGDGNELGHKNAMNIPPFQEGQTIESEVKFDGVWEIVNIHHIVNEDVWGIFVECEQVEREEVFVGE